MKKLLVIAIVLLIGAGVYTGRNPAEADRYAASIARNAELGWSKIEANPIPIILALGTFVLTFVYHKAKGKSFRESVEVAATRVTVVNPPAIAPSPENPVLKRARDRAARTQLLADQIEIRNRIAKLPDQVTKAEKEVCFAEKAVFDAKVVLGEKHKVRNLAVSKLTSLRNELTAGSNELTAIDAELAKLAN
jgi:hypothetical protein